MDAKQMKEDIGSVLKEWTLTYLQNRDLLTRTIVSVAKDKDGWDLVITTKTEPRYVKIVPDLAVLNQVIGKFDDNNVLIVTLNTKSNIDLLASQWTDVIGFKKLNIMFVNPNSNQDKKWVILPHIHERISERKALKLGLMSLFSNVDEYVD